LNLNKNVNVKFYLDERFKMRFREIYENLNQTYSFSSVQFKYDNEIAGEVLRFSSILLKEDDLYYDEDGGSGRENDIHTTILYGIISPSSNKVRPLLNKLTPFEVELGDISFFEQEECDVMKIEVHSSYLHYINALLKENIDYQTNYPEYIPHCTIAYLKKGVKERLNFDKRYFNGMKQDVFSVEFSSKDGSLEKIKLNG
jgi:hypothetical protein